jgi:hypothetical protein
MTAHYLFESGSLVFSRGIEVFRGGWSCGGTIDGLLIEYFEHQLLFVHSFKASNANLFGEFSEFRHKHFIQLRDIVHKRMENSVTKTRCRILRQRESS